MNADLLTVEDALYDRDGDPDFLFSRSLQTICEQYLRSRAGGRWKLELTGEKRSYLDGQSTRVRLGAACHYNSVRARSLDAAVSSVSYALAHETAHARHTPLAKTSPLNIELARIGRHDPERETVLSWLWNTVEDGRVEQLEGRENRQAGELFAETRESLYRQLTTRSLPDSQALQIAFAYRARGGLKPLSLPWAVEVCLVECDQPIADALAHGNVSLKPLERMFAAVSGRALVPDVGYYRRRGTPLTVR